MWFRGVFLAVVSRRSKIMEFSRTIYLSTRLYVYLLG